MRVLIYMAMGAEAGPVCSALGLSRTVAPGELAGLPAEVHQGRVHAQEGSGGSGGSAGARGERLDTGLSVALVRPGVDPAHGVDLIGTEAAALTVHEAVRALEPDLVLKAGTCGGFGAVGGEVGRVYLSEGPFRFHDRRVPLEGFEAVGVGERWGPDASALRSRLGLEGGAVSTGGSLDCTEAERALLVSGGVVAKEMEAASLAWAASLSDWRWSGLGRACVDAGRVPLLAIKGVSDLVDDPEPVSTQFMANLERASVRVCECVVGVLRGLAESPGLVRIGG